MSGNRAVGSLVIVLTADFDSSPGMRLTAVSRRTSEPSECHQPVLDVLDSLAPKTGQVSGRMVVNLALCGPAEVAGIRIGDVLLTLNGHSATGSHAMRALPGADRIGTQGEVRPPREGSVLTTFVTVARQPPG